MSKIKSVSQFEDGIWGTETPIGADASNVDVEMSDSSTKDLQTVLGDIPSAAAPIQSQINTKVTASGGNIGNTTVSSGIQNFDSSSSETSTELLDTSVRVTNATEVTSSMWTKFNRFRKRVDNKFKDVFLSSVEDVASPSDYKTYSQSALNDYFANVVGYASASDLPDATSTIAQQLSTLNNNLMTPIVDVLYSGNKYSSGNLSLPGYDQYLWLDLCIITNQDRFYEKLPLYGGNYEPSRQIMQGGHVSIMKMAYGSNTIYFSEMNITGGMDMIVVSTSYNNANWILGIIKIHGVKFIQI